MTFRHATPADLEDVLSVIARCDEVAQGWAPQKTPPGEADREIVGRLLASEDDHNEVVEIGGEVVGYANLQARDGVAHLSFLFVDPARHGQGIGTQLMERALDEARRRGHRRATLGTAVLNTPARLFYERAGWRDTGGRLHHKYLGLEMAEYVLDLP